MQDNSSSVPFGSYGHRCFAIFTGYHKSIWFAFHPDGQKILISRNKRWEINIYHSEMGLRGNYLPLSTALSYFNTGNMRAVYISDTWKPPRRIVPGNVPPTWKPREWQYTTTKEHNSEHKTANKNKEIAEAVAGVSQAKRSKSVWANEINTSILSKRKVNVKLTPAIRPMRTLFIQ